MVPPTFPTQPGNEAPNPHFETSNDSVIHFIHMWETVSSQRAFTTHKHHLWLMQFWLNWQSCGTIAYETGSCISFSFNGRRGESEVGSWFFFYWKSNDNIFSAESSGGRISGGEQQILICKQDDSYWCSKLCLLGELCQGSLTHKQGWGPMLSGTTFNLRVVLYVCVWRASRAQAMYGLILIKIYIRESDLIHYPPLMTADETI